MDKIDRLFDAMEHPERYTPAEIETMLQDPEVKETFDLLDKTKSSLRTIVTPDIDDEWKKFENTHRNTGVYRNIRPVGLFYRKVAASIAIGIVSLTAVAAIVGVGVNYFNHRDAASVTTEVTAETAAAAYTTDTIATTQVEQAAEPEVVIFDNETLEDIISAISAYYGYEVAYGNDTTRSLRLYFRWKQELPIEEVVESLNNFEQISLTIKDKTIKID